MSLKLNVGCGNAHKDGFVNIDRVDPCDLVLDLEKDILPYSNGMVDEIVAENLLVMLGNIRHIMNECWRVLDDNGELELLNFDAGKYPQLYFQDPEHKRGFTDTTYKYFCPDSGNYYNDFGIKYGYMPWKLLKIEPVGKCLKVRMQPKRSGLS